MQVAFGKRSRLLQIQGKAVAGHVMFAQQHIHQVGDLDSDTQARVQGYDTDTEDSAAQVVAKAQQVVQGRADFAQVELAGALRS